MLHIFTRGPSGPDGFSCPACTQKMTFGDRQCSACHENAPIYNRHGFWPILWIFVAATILGLLVL